MRRTWRKAKPKITKQFRANKQITAREVFLIDHNGEKRGKVSIEEAREIATQNELDLVEVNPKGDCPVVKIMNYGQFKYEEEKKAHKQRAQQKKIETKGIRLSVRISAHDFNFRVDQAVKFLSKGNKLKIEVVLRGRERQHPRKVTEVINKFVAKIEENEELEIEREQPLTRQGGRFTIILLNKKV